jgi:hypothetical protein
MYTQKPQGPRPGSGLPGGHYRPPQNFNYPASLKHLMVELLKRGINPLKSKIVKISGQPYYLQPGTGRLPPSHQGGNQGLGLGHGNYIVPNRRSASVTSEIDSENVEELIRKLSENDVREVEDDEELRALLEDTSIDTQTEKVVQRGVLEELDHLGAESLNFMRRLALKNDIGGDEVTTAQKVRELNFGKNSELNAIARRMAVDNAIHGKHVTTAQDVTELNAPPTRINVSPVSFSDLDLDVPVKAARRLALKNDFEGDEVTTAQKIRELNLNEKNNGMNAIARRMAVDNAIHGKHVTTAQDATELNAAPSSLRSRSGQSDLDDELEKLLNEANTLKLF